jgi:hypothetical protein
MEVLNRLSALSAPEPALTSLWKVMIDSGSTLLLAESMTLSWIKVPAEGRFAGGKNQYFPGFAEMDGLAITFYETHDHAVGKWLQEWQRQIYDPATEIYGIPGAYRKKITANLYSKYSQQAAKAVTYVDCWPTDRGPYELNYSDDTGRIVIQAQFAVNKVIEN